MPDRPHVSVKFQLKASQHRNILQMGDSPEVGPLEILRVSFLLGNGQAPSDIPSDTKNSIRVVH